MQMEVLEYIIQFLQRVILSPNHNGVTVNTLHKTRPDVYKVRFSIHTHERDREHELIANQTALSVYSVLPCLWHIGRMPAPQPGTVPVVVSEERGANEEDEVHDRLAVVNNRRARTIQT